MTAYVGVIGPGGQEVPPDRLAVAEEVGRLLGRAGAVVVSGGLGGIMQAACRGAKASGGTTLGLLPGERRDQGNRWLDLSVATGLGEARNVLVVRASDVLIAVGGGYGTLSEIAFALKTAKPVVGLDTWDVPGVRAVATAGEAVSAALEAAG